MILLIVFGLLCLISVAIMVATVALVLHYVSKDDDEKPKPPQPDPQPDPQPKPDPIVVGGLKYGCAKDALNDDAPYSCRLMTPEEGGQWTSKEDCRCWSCDGATCMQVTDSHRKGSFSKCSTCAYSCM